MLKGYKLLRITGQGLQFVMEKGFGIRAGIYTKLS